MVVIRGIGYVLLLLAVLVLVHAGLLWQGGVPIFERTGGEHWFITDPEGLNLAQAVVQRYLHPTLWDPLIVTVLLWPVGFGLAAVAAVLGIPGLLLVTLFRRRKRRLMR